METNIDLVRCYSVTFRIFACHMPGWEGRGRRGELIPGQAFGSRSDIAVRLFIWPGDLLSSRASISHHRERARKL